MSPEKNYNFAQLTTLRFFAAFLILIHHSQKLFNLPQTPWTPGQGVSFFFVLSGFILTIIYPNLTSFAEIKRFWLSRFARIWPTYIVSLIIGFFLAHYTWHSSTVLMSLFLLQGWIPASSYYFSYNAVCWSLSALAFFYLVFPFLLYKWHQYWKIKLLLSIFFLITLLWLINHLHLPSYIAPGDEAKNHFISQHGLVYINPLIRIFEFILGMATATLWGKIKKTPPFSWATFYEIIALTVCALFMCNTAKIVSWGQAVHLGEPASMWLIFCSSCLAFSFLIFIMAQGRGLITKICLWSPLVLLGEISFCIYLLHQILLTAYRQNISLFPSLPHHLNFFIFLIILLIAAYLLWICVEIPGRRLLLEGTFFNKSAPKEDWHHYIILSKKFLLASMLLIGILGACKLYAKLPAHSPDVMVTRPSNSHKN